MGKDFRVIFVSKNYLDSVSFYKNQLGLPVITSWDRSEAEKGTVFQIGSGSLEVLGPNPSQAYKPPTAFELAIEVEDVDDFYSFVKNSNIPIRGELSDKPWGHRAFSITDPDGIKLIFYSIISK